MQISGSLWPQMSIDEKGFGGDLQRESRRAKSNRARIKSTYLNFRECGRSTLFRAPRRFSRLENCELICVLLSLALLDAARLSTLRS